MILDESQARRIIEKTLALASADEARVNLSGGRGANTRVALNSVTTCGDADNLSVAVTAAFGTRHATATGSETDDAALERLVHTAEDMARVAPEDPEYVPELGPQDYLDIHPWFESTARATQERSVDVARAAIDAARERGVTVAAFFQHNHGFSALGNSSGLFAYTQGTDASLSVTARTTDGAGSGYAADNSRDIDEIDAAAASRRAIEKAEASRSPKTLEPGVYPAILEPLAAAEFLAYAVWNMNARQADEGRSFYATTGGGNKIGEKIVGDNITFTSDPQCPALLSSPFSGDGLPARPHTWIESGVLKKLFYGRYWASKQDTEPCFPSNTILAGGEKTLDEIIADTDRAVLVTRFWYIRSLDPQTILVTGLTRDGVFWVEDGAIQHSVKNFRFNESPIAVLNKVTALSQPTRVGNSLTPALRTSAFTFSSLSEAV